MFFAKLVIKNTVLTDSKKVSGGVPMLEQKLQDIAKSILNPQSMPTDAHMIRENFLKFYPKEKWQSMTLEEFAIGSGKQTACWWLEFNMQALGSIRGGSAQKFQIYLAKNGEYVYDMDYFDSAQAAWETMRREIVEMLDLAGQSKYEELDRENQILYRANAFRMKLLFIYYPDRFLPIYSINHLYHFLKFFEVSSSKWEKKSVVSANRTLGEFKNENPLFKDWDPIVFMQMIYEHFPPTRGYWKIAPGPKASIWDECIENEYIAIGWDEVGDLSNYSSLADLKKKVQMLFYRDSPQMAGRKARELWNFYNLKPGDRVLANDGQTRIVGIGTVAEKGYQFREDLIHEYKHTVAVNWDKDFKPREIASQKDWFSSTVKSLSDRLFMELTSDKPVISNFTPQEESFFSRMEQLLDQKGQIILYGPPGTGKTYLARKYIDWAQEKENLGLLEDTRKFKARRENVELVTFHPSFNYEDFMEGFKPSESEKGQITFKLEQGIFRVLCNRAEADPKRPYFLIIDELNRGNVAKIFGELLTVIEKDKRGVPVRLPQSKEWFSISSNVYIIATMNTADRSIKLLDAALKRRFAFIEVLPDAGLLDVPVENTNITLADIMNGLNLKLREVVGRDKQIGHAYFMRNDAPITTINDLKLIYRYEIIPLIQEYCYDEYQQLADIIDTDLEEIIEDIFEGSDDNFTLALISRFSAQR